MIIELEKNILLANDSIIGHCCNTQNTMRSGVAKVLRCRFPEVYKADKASYIRMGKALLGCSILVPVVTKPAETPIKFIANMYGQPNYGYTGKRYVDYEAIYQCLEQLKGQVEKAKYRTVGLPFKIASDRAGGHWPIVYEMIRHIFDNTPITVNLYKYDETLRTGNGVAGTNGTSNTICTRVSGEGS